MNFFTSDQHFGHDNIIEFTGRPFLNTNQMDSSLIAYYNSKVINKDTIYFLGDLTLQGPSHR